MNKDGSNSAINQNSSDCTEHSMTSKRINELTHLHAEHDYWQSKVLEKNLFLLNDTLVFSKKKEEIRSRLDRAAAENIELINKIKELETSVVNDKKTILDNNKNLSEINNNVPLIEKNNIEIYNDVK